MKNSYLLLFLSLLCGRICTAQGVFSNQTNYALEKVVQDYPSQFKNIKGELLTSGAGSAAYKSTVTIPGAVSTTIVQSAGVQKETISWQSVVYAGKDFKTAKNRFEELFNQIKNTIIKPEGEKAAIVNGLYIDPSEDKTFTTVQFDLMPATPLLQKINIDLMLKNTGKEWKILLSVYDKDIKEAGTLTSK